jgi:PPOX class probable F420-dependent enzyme
MGDSGLSADERAFLDDARRAVLATIGSDGRPRLVPICFVLDPKRPVLYTPLDEKPKSTDDTMHLARVRDVLADPRVSVLADRWDEEWANLAWLRCHGTGTIIAADTPAVDERGPAIAALRRKYPQYGTHALEALPIIRITIERTTSWGALVE